MTIMVSFNVVVKDTDEHEDEASYVSITEGTAQTKTLEST